MIAPLCVFILSRAYGRFLAPDINAFAVEVGDWNTMIAGWAGPFKYAFGDGAVSVAANDPRAFVSLADSPGLSFPVGLGEILHPTTVWDRAVLSARFDDASKRPQWLADKLHGQKTTESSGKILRTPPDGRKRAVSHLTPNTWRLRRKELLLKRAD